MNDKENSYYSKEELVREILKKDRDLKESNINEEMIHELINGKVSKNINEADDENSTLGQRVADKIAEFGGSWTFIISFCVVLVVWILGNAFILSNKAFDPYPFVFLNLVLSCLAALQAPIIMMSQNRQSEKDRLTAANDYLINLKSEIIVEDLHYKLDLLMEQQAENTKTIETLLKKIDELENKR
ncbi:DUF1003 domain-containing protein [Inconstantimicrobium mannanitabidum]|uniref:Uncharacterized protein n=1 Tax=Inconstantimicrobium mannanitabidum TaxID=1604901 RepID=A0ACB5RAI7_9CLOT|nr:DUF1003 domain-containing protein [Clostridium sp. TW13]GKX65874.1 hypothetical protein rsdtw13_11320 [Clostridium sp. TW13]